MDATYPGGGGRVIKGVEVVDSKGFCGDSVGWACESIEDLQGITIVRRCRKMAK